MMTNSEITSRIPVMTSSNLGTVPMTAAMMKKRVPMIHVIHAVYVRGHTMTWANKMRAPMRSKIEMIRNKVNMVRV